MFFKSEDGTIIIVFNKISIVRNFLKSDDVYVEIYFNDRSRNFDLYGNDAREFIYQFEKYLNAQYRF